MADQSERIILEAEDNVTPITSKANASLQSFEKQAESSYGKVLRISDQTRNSVQRITDTVQKQAEVYGKVGVDKLISQRDQLLQRYNKEPAAIDAITKSYEKMIDVQKKLDQATVEAERKRAEAQAASQRASAGQATAGWFQDPFGNLKTKATELLTAIGPVGGAIAGVTTLVGGLAVAGFEAAKSLGEYGTKIRDVEIRTGLTAKEVGEFSYAARAVNQDVSIFEHTMRGLTAALEDDSPKAERARESLRKFGVDIDAVKNGTASTSDVLLKISEGLSGISNTFERNAAGIDIFKKAWIEVAPAMTELSEGVKRAKELGFGPTEAEVDLFRDYQKTVAATSMAWEQMSRSVKQGAANLAMWFMTAGDAGGGHEPGKPHQLIPEPGFRVDMTGTVAGDISRGLRERSDAAIAAAMSKGPLSDAEKELARLQGNLVASTDKGWHPGINEATLGKIAAQKSRIEYLKEQTGGVFKVREGYDTEGRGEVPNMLPSLYGPSFPGSDAVSIFSAPEETQPDEQNRANAAGMVARVKSDAAGRERVEKAILSMREQEVKLTTADELTAAQKIRDLRLQAADTAVEKQIVLIDYAKQEAKVRADAIAEQTAAQEKQFDSLQKTSERLIETLFTRPSQFARQLMSTVTGAMLQPVIQGAGRMAATGLMGLGLFGSGMSPGVGSVADMTPEAISIPAGVGFGSGFMTTAAGGGGIAPMGWGAGSPAGWSGGTAASGSHSLFGGLGNLSALRSSFFNSGSIATGSGTATTAAGIGGFGGNLAGVMTSRGMSSLEMGIGMPLALSGLTGNSRGTLGGFGQSVIGGALTGAGIGTMILPGVGSLIGAGIGAVAGGLASAFSALFGVESPEHEAVRLVGSIYHVGIDTAMGKQIAGIAQQKYAGHVSMAVRDPDVIKSIMLFAQGTAQGSGPLMSSQPRAGNLMESGGGLYQAPTYVNGTPYTFASNLPTAGGYGGGNLPGPTYIAMHVDGQGLAPFMTGQYVTPSFVQNQWAAAGANSDGRMGNSALLNDPGLVLS